MIDVYYSEKKGLVSLKKEIGFKKLGYIERRDVDGFKLFIINSAVSKDIATFEEMELRFKIFKKPISVVMPVYLGDYQTKMGDKMIRSASRKDAKFVRAVGSFLRNIHYRKELIIVGDGFDVKVKEIYNGYFKPFKSIRLMQIPKQELWSGQVRQAGVDTAIGDIVTYLDADDYIGENHLYNIAESYIKNPNSKWAYYDDYIGIADESLIIKEDITDYDKKLYKREVFLKHGSIGTSSYCHSGDVDVNWYDGHGHDWLTIKNCLINQKYPYHKIENAQYHVCHFPSIEDKVFDV